MIPEERSNGFAMLDSLLACISFHFNQHRLSYLRETCAGIMQLARLVHIVIITNQSEKASVIKQALADLHLDLEILVPTLIGHPYLLTWSHLDVFRRESQYKTHFTHFLYAEDDILLCPENISYWLEGRQRLREYGLIPAFLRYETHPLTGELYSTDSLARVCYAYAPKVPMNSDGYEFVCLPNPYQGMYLLDRELLLEHLAGPSSSPDFGRWRIRERAAQGITFLNVPKGFTSRNLVGCLPARMAVDPRCLIKHLPGNYVSDPSSPLAKIKVDDIFVSRLGMVRIQWRIAKMRAVWFVKESLARSG